MERRVHEQTIQGKLNGLHISESEIFVDNEARRRSGHMSHAMLELGNGKYMIFNANSSATRAQGHGAYGWIEYCISDDYCHTFGELRDFPYSKECFLNGDCTISVEKAVVCDDGTIVVFCLRNGILSEICCEPWDTCMVIRSYDEGESWDTPTELCCHKGRVYDVRYHDGVIYALLFCNDASVTFTGNNPFHVYRLYKSEDNGKTFTEVCVVPFDNTLGHAYGAMIFNEENELIVYSYNIGDERNLDYIISPDGGNSWTRSGKSYCKNRIRNPQINKLDGQYILHGRAGAGAGFVLYTSEDGIDWDDGVLLDTQKPSCYYSNNVIIHEPGQPDTMLIKYSELYEPNKSKCVNGMMIRLQSIKD